MKDKIIHESINSLRQDGLKFSIDTLADKLKISKKRKLQVQVGHPHE